MNEDQIQDLDVHETVLRDMGPLVVPDPDWGDLKLRVFPFLHDGVTPIKLPRAFADYEETLRQIMAHIPVQPDATQHFVTIDSQYFTQDGFQRREGVHMDGNFCADYAISPMATWGGGKGTWAGIVALSPVEMPDNSHVRVGFQIPYDIVIPVGKYVSGTLGGTIVASSQVGCQAWSGTFIGRVEEGGSWENMLDQLGEPVVIEANRLYFMTSNCPHETLKLSAGTRRTFVRVTLAHNYDNTCLRQQ